MSTLSIINDTETLEELEGVIDAALARQVPIYIEIGTALIKIHNRRLYGHSFERYVKGRFGFSRSVAYDYVRAATVVRALQLEGKSPPLSVRAALALVPKKPKKEKKAAEPVHTPAENATPVPEDPSRPTPTMQANLLSLFSGVDVVLKDSSTPGRWYLSVDDATTDQVRGVAMVFSGKKPTSELVTDSFDTALTQRLEDEVADAFGAVTVRGVADDRSAVDFTWHHASIADIIEFAKWRRPNL
jgi:hypothetical protein